MTLSFPTRRSSDLRRTPWPDENRQPYRAAARVAITLLGHVECDDAASVPEILRRPARSADHAHEIRKPQQQSRDENHPRRATPQTTDRKRTRLNSSH